ncbi:cytochrome P450 [Xylaria intraflava]|nr:cytochrome P450 [Xylaria intraflava]
MASLIFALIFVLFLLLCQVLLGSGGSARVFVKPQKGDRDDISDAVLRGYQQFTQPSGKPFFVRYWRQDYMVLPVKYLADVRRADKNHLAFSETIRDVLFIYSWIGTLFESNRLVAAVIKGVNPQLSVLSHPLIQESSFAFEKELGLAIGESKTFNTIELMTNILLRTMTRVIGGRELSRNEKFLEGIKAYFNGIFLTGSTMLKMPSNPWIRNFLAWPLYTYHQRFRQQPLIDMIKPIAARRLQGDRSGIDEKHDFDIIQCSLDRLDEFPFDKNSRTSPIQTLSQEILHMVWASGQSPALIMASVLYKLLEEPSYIEPLRDEVRLAVKNHGWTDGIYRDLPKMDSFIREINRVHPGFSLAVSRIVQDRPFVFSDGFTIPPGVRIAFPAEASQHDPEIIGGPAKFDGFRFARLAEKDARQEDGANRWAATHTSNSNFAFGYGNHACPGRFISVRALKTILARILLDYDFFWDRTGGAPPRQWMEGISVPDVKQEITFRRRKTD